MGRREKRWGWRCQDGKVLRLISVGASLDSFFTFFCFVWEYIFFVRLGFTLLLRWLARWWVIWTLID